MRCGESGALGRDEMTRKPGPGRDSGAAALEFALVVPVLLILVFGIIDYGLYFANSLGARSGVREAARQGVVENYDAGDCFGAQRLRTIGDGAQAGLPRRQGDGRDSR